jgi:hypothetical protein
MGLFTSQTFHGAWPADCDELTAVVFDRDWRTEAVTGLSRVIAAGDRSILPILADALDDAGCDAAELLTHCRRPGPHAPDCWAVRLVAEVPAPTPVTPDELFRALGGQVDAAVPMPAAYTIRTFARNVAVGVATNVAVGVVFVVVVLSIRAALFGNPF